MNRSYFPWAPYRARVTTTPSIVALWMIACLAVSSGHAQSLDWKSEALRAQEELVEVARFMQPKDFGINLPEGQPARYPWKRVLTVTDHGKGCVAKVHAMVGDNFLVMLPNGGIVPRLAKDVEPTDREFKPMLGEEIAKELLQDPRLRGFRSKITKDHVFIYNTTDGFTSVATKLMKSMYRGVAWYAKDQGIRVRRPYTPLVVIMFNRQHQFLSYQRVPDGVVAYYDMIENHVVLHEESGMASYSRELARQELLSTIAHEGAHQILFNIGVQQRLSRWPMWLGEGLAEYLAPTKASQNYKWKGTGRVNDMRMWELEMFLQKQHIKGFQGETLDWIVRAPALDSTGYATAWSVTHFLAENHKEEFDAYMRYLSNLPPLFAMMGEDMEDEVELNAEQFKRFFGKDMKQIENDLVAHMTQQKYDSPVETLPHYVGTATISKLGETERKHACFYVSDVFVKEWRQSVIDSLPENDRRFVSFETSIHTNRNTANRYIRKWLKEE